MNWNTIRILWWGCIYDRYENGTKDVDFLLSLLGEPKNVLEICCGTGRVLVPLAKAGHTVTGFDRDSGMLARLPAKAEGLPNIRYYLADALTSDWGEGYDAVILADNTFENIDAAQDDEQAQELMIIKASSALKKGGHFFFAFDLYADPMNFFTLPGGKLGYHGTDDFGVYGQFISGKSGYDPQTRIAKGDIRLEMRLPGGETHVFEEEWSKHVPTLAQVHAWLDAYGFSIEQEFNGYDRKPFVEGRYNNAVIWAKKE